MAEGHIISFVIHRLGSILLAFIHKITMAHNAQKYRYNGMVVEVRRIMDVPHGGRFQCLVRGYGHRNPAPRETYVLDTETPAIASRNAIQMYVNKYGQDKH